METVVSRRSTGVAQTLFTGGSYIWNNPLHMLQVYGATGAGAGAQLYDLGYNHDDATCMMRQGHQIMAKRLGIKVVIDPFDNLHSAGNLKSRTTYMVRVVEYTPCVSGTVRTTSPPRPPIIPDPVGGPIIDFLRNFVLNAIHAYITIRFMKNNADGSETDFGIALGELRDASIQGTPAPGADPLVLLMTIEAVINEMIAATHGAHGSWTDAAVQLYMDQHASSIQMLTHWYNASWFNRLIVKNTARVYGVDAQFQTGNHWLPFLKAMAENGWNYAWAAGFNASDNSVILDPAQPEYWPTGSLQVSTFTSLNDVAYHHYMALSNLFQSAPFSRYVVSNFYGAGVHTIFDGQPSHDGTQQTQSTWLSSMGHFLKDMTSSSTNADIPPAHDFAYLSAGGTMPPDLEAKAEASFTAALEHFQVANGTMTGMDTQFTTWMRQSTTPFPSNRDVHEANQSGSTSSILAAAIASFSAANIAPITKFGDQMLTILLMAYAAFYSTSHGQSHRQMEDAFHTANANNTADTTVENTSGTLQLTHSNLFIGVTNATPSAPPTAVALGGSVPTASGNMATLPLLAQSVNTRNSLGLRVLKSRTVSVSSGGDTPARGQLVLDMSIPYNKKVNFERNQFTGQNITQAATPLGRDIAVIITPVSTDLEIPASLGAGSPAGSLDDIRRAGYCHITSELFFKDP